MYTDIFECLNYKMHSPINLYTSYIRPSIKVKGNVTVFFKATSTQINHSAILKYTQYICIS